ncbi:MAG: hypothetical protein OEW48_03730 [Phycisphaerae bacterium]|nr:hypothetical protein [Phycisphaerae bacterium]
MVKLIFIFTSFLLFIPCQARTIYVADDGSADFNNIQSAIDDSNDGDIIIVQTGQYIENINFIGKNITLRSTEPMNPSVVASTVIDGSLSGSVVTFAGTESSACILSGFTITNGSGTGVGYNYGGGIYGNGTLATVQYNIISGNWASSPMFPSSGYGGGIYDCDGIIRYNVISENNATCDEGTASGGGIYGCDGTIKNNIIWGNSAGGFSGGGDIEGGGLSNCNGTIQNNVVSGNYAGGWWGGARGGGLSNCSGTIQNNTIFGNRSEETRSGYIDYGGGLSGCDGTIRNCIIWQNIADQGAQIYVSSTPSFSCIEDWLSGGDGNIDLDPRFVSIGYWHLCGLPPYDYLCWLETGDYHLRSLAGRCDPDEQTWAFDFETSPCIDAGNPGCLVGDEPAPNGNRRNMGAYGGTAEASKSPANWRNIADMTNDWIVDSNDLKVFVDYWLQMGECIPSDLNYSQFVDFKDFALFGLQWSYPSSTVPGMTFHVDDCNMEAGPSWPVSAESNEPLFSVWVEGRYIHFEDLITANCCLDEIELQMTVEDGLITIYEIEHLTTPCFCICDYPTTATLGPFEPGIYLLEVIDIDGKSLGIVEVTIGGITGPGITYQIKDCNRDASEIYTAEPPDLTRFTVTVEGPYIHFKDMMTANCCPDKLELEMAVEDNLISIYETEYTSEGCRCMCSFPITATLGPFETGIYALEVYETTGGFIGTTTITIDPGG